MVKIRKEFVTAASLVVASTATSHQALATCTQNDQPDRKREFRYAITQVPGLGGGSDLARGMNDAGQIVGDGLDPKTQERHPFYWNESINYDLGTFGGDGGSAYDINNSGWVVGWAQRPGSMHSHAFLWTYRDGLIALEEPSGAVSSGAYAINDRGQIVGTLQPDGRPRLEAVIWEDKKIRNINTLGEDVETEGRDINEKGYVTGSIGFSPLDSAMFLWDGKEMIALDGSLGDGERVWPAEPWGINDSLNIVGWGDVDYNNQRRPFAWRKGTWHNMLRPISDKGFDNGTAWDINNANQIVGEIRYAPLGEFFGFIAQAGDGIQIINDFLPPHNAWNIKTARAINKHGQIAATGQTTEPPAGTYALLLTPINPEMELEIADGPLRADAINTFSITNAQPGATIKFFYGKKGGGKRIPGCDALAAMTQIDDPVAFGEAVADADGNAELDIYIPPRGAVHWGFLLQAVDFDNCEESQLVLKKVE